MATTGRWTSEQKYQIVTRGGSGGRAGLNLIEVARHCEIWSVRTRMVKISNRSSDLLNRGYCPVLNHIADRRGGEIRG